MMELKQNHPVVAAGQEIIRVDTAVFDTWGDGYQVGVKGVTRIEATWKNGSCSHIPYIRH